MNAEQPLARDARPDEGFARGMLLLLLLHLLQVPMTWLSGGISVWFIGVTQLLYFIPALVLLIVKKRSETSKGLCTAAAITFLLNATCTAIFFWAVE